MSRRHPSSLKSNSEMNLTAMSDLTFLLLITFIITFPMIEQGVKIKLPDGKAEQVDPQKQTSVVTVDQEGRIFLGSELIELEALEQTLKLRLAQEPNLRLLIRGDTDVHYGRVVEVARISQRLGITRMALATSGEE